MSDVKHTPHPWKAVKGHDGDSDRWTVVQDINPYRQWLIAVIENGAPGDFCETEGINARLVAAAPELLAACEEFVRKVECGEARSTRSYAQMKAAITKAKLSN